eukprot:TRINITY_DN21716_c0_g1_i1.p1 TRINITY_DN21716_c0_g1~~TRINITY_DN21716_c0_g1_i1.p1  ORF type:complete len:465 (-),score=96.00 TRINITY_DN21716_c0_g1_i1:767-2161(-)
MKVSKALLQRGTVRTRKSLAHQLKGTRTLSTNVINGHTKHTIKTRIELWSNNSTWRQKLKTAIVYVRPIVVLGGLPAVYINGSTTHPEGFTIPTSLRSSYESISDSKPVIVSQPSFWAIIKYYASQLLIIFSFCTSITLTSYIIGNHFSIPALRLGIDRNLYEEFSTYLYALAPTTLLMSILLFFFKVGSYKTVQEYRSLRNKALLGQHFTEVIDTAREGQKWTEVVKILTPNEIRKKFISESELKGVALLEESYLDDKPWTLTMLYEHGVLSSDESESFLEYGRKYKESKEAYQRTQQAIAKDIDSKLFSNKIKRNDKISFAEREFLSSAEKLLEREIIQNWEINIKRAGEELAAKKIGDSEYRNRINKYEDKKDEKLRQLRPQMETRRRRKEEEIEKANQEFLKEKQELLRSTGGDVLLQKTEEKFAEDTKALNAKFNVVLAECKKKHVKDYIIPERLLLAK